MTGAGASNAILYAVSIAMDTSAPTTTATVTAIADNLGVIQGTMSTGGRTDDPSWMISGTLSVVPVTARNDDTAAVDQRPTPTPR